MSLVHTIEISIVGLNLVYLVLIATNRAIGWWFGVAASVLRVWLFIEVNYLAEPVLYLYYVGMGIYGYFNWKKEAKTPTTATKIPITTRSPLYHVGLIAIGLILTLLLAQLLKIIGSENVYADAISTIFSFIATWMVARRILENWIYWIVIDLFSVWLYGVRDLPIYAAQMAVFSIMAAVGYALWRREYLKQSKDPVTE